MEFESMIEAVRDFHKEFEIEGNLKPRLLNKDIQILRSRLIFEEAVEYLTALGEDDLEGVADSLGDLLYVVLGAAVSHGLDLEGVFWEIHRSNMTKVGGYKDQGGKLIKPDTYDPPDLKPFVE